MARGVGEGRARHEIQFCELPESFQRWYENEAVERAQLAGQNVSDYWDLNHDARRATRKRAVEAWMDGVRR